MIAVALLLLPQPATAVATSMALCCECTPEGSTLALPLSFCNAPSPCRAQEGALAVPLQTN